MKSREIRASSGALIEVHRMALEFIRQHSFEDLADAVMKTPMTEATFKGLDRRLVVEMFHRIKPGFGTGCLSRTGFEVEMKLAVDYKLVKRPITFEEFADTKFAGACP